MDTKHQISVLNCHSDIVKAVCVSNNRKFIISGSMDRSINVWSTQEDTHTIRVKSL